MDTPPAAALIELLHRHQRQQHWLPPHRLQRLARELALPLSRVQGVASFYHLFALEPPAPHRCAVCLGTACFVRGADRLVMALQQRFGCALGQRSVDRQWQLERLGCVAACSRGPLLQRDGEVLGPAPVADGPQLAAWLSAQALPAAAGEPG